MQSFFAKNELMKNLMKILKLRAILEQFKAKFRQRKMKNSCGKFNIHFVTRARIVFSARKFFSRKNHFFHYPRKPFHQFKKIFFDKPYDTNGDVLKSRLTKLLISEQFWRVDSHYFNKRSTLAKLDYLKSIKKS